jgi:hypothetical protein
LVRIKAGPADEDAHTIRFEFAERGEALCTLYGQLDSAIEEDQAPQLRSHFVQGTNKVKQQLAAEEIISASQVICPDQ